jgi:hypothetical protein
LREGGGMGGVLVLREGGGRVERGVLRGCSVV